jgi:hypothetical protein
MKFVVIVFGAIANLVGAAAAIWLAVLVFEGFTGK